MQQIRIAADSSCDLLTLAGADFISVPLTIRTDEAEYRDDASLDVAAMTDALRHYKGRSYSSCPNIADWESAFGETGDVLVFPITSNLSGSFAAACAAKASCEERNPSRRIHVFDTLTVGPETVLLIEKAVALLKTGADFNEVCRAVTEYQTHTHLLFALESLHNFAQNGRVSRLTAAAAGVLGIRAAGQASAEGTLELLEKCRGETKTLDFFLRQIEKLGYTGGRAAIGHCQNEPFAQKLREEILRLFPKAEIELRPLRGLCSYYAELGGILLGFEA